MRGNRRLLMLLLKITLVFVLLSVWLIGCSGSKGPEPGKEPIREPYYGPKKRIAVLDFEVKARGALGDAGRGLSEMLISALHDTGRFVVVEREAMASILQEQGLGDLGVLRPGTISKIGDILGVQSLVKGVITQFHEEMGSTGIGRFKVDTVKGSVAMDIRVFDTSTGVIHSSHATVGEGTKRNIGGTAVIKGVVITKGGAFEKTALGEASRQCINRAVSSIVGEMKKVPWQRSIASVEANQIYISKAGKDSGIKVGDVMEIWKRGEELTDPNTGESLGHKTTKIGLATVYQIDEKFSIANVTEGVGVSRGDIVKLLEE